MNDYGNRKADPSHGLRKMLVKESRPAHRLANSSARKWTTFAKANTVTHQRGIGTDPEVHIQALPELFNSGATEIHIHSGQPDQKRVVDFYGKEVLPEMQKVADAA